MIKVIAFDLVGVLVREQNIELTEVESTLERMYGDNLDDSTYIKRHNELTDQDVNKVANNIFDKLYLPTDREIFNKIKEKYPDIKLVVASNHVSYIKNYINNTFKGIDDIIVSAEIGKIKPNSDFYEYILHKYGIKPEELLFLDDSQRNIDGALKLGIKTIKVEKSTNLYGKIEESLNNANI